jgi:hypothetical protein
VLKDFTLGSLQQCTAHITTDIFKKTNGTYEGPITGTTVPANTTIRDTATVTGTAGFPTPTGTVTFNRFTNDTCTGTAAASETATDGLGWRRATLRHLRQAVPVQATAGTATTPPLGQLTVSRSRSRSLILP